MLLCAGVNSDQTSMAQPSPNQVDPLDPFEVYLHQECPAPAEAIIPLSNNHSFTTTTLRACAELCYAKQHCVAAKFRIDRSISSCTLLSIGCPIDSAKKQTKMTDEVTEILLIKS